MADVTVHQINSRKDGSKDQEAYFNVNENYGSVEVWGFASLSVGKITILARQDAHFRLIQFTSKEYFNEWIQENPKWAWTQLEV